MICKKCGYPIKNDIKECEHCGLKINEIEYHSGFLDQLDTGIGKINEKTVKLIKTDIREKKKINKTYIMFCCCMLLFFYIIFLSAKINKLNSLSSIQENRYSDLYEQYVSCSNDYIKLYFLNRQLDIYSNNEEADYDLLRSNNELEINNIIKEHYLKIKQNRISIGKD